MGATGFAQATEGHNVMILPPQNISGGVSSTPFHLRNASKVDITLLLGALSAAPGAVTLNACTSNTGANPTPIGFNYYSQATSGATNDVLSTRNVATAAGFVPANAANTFYILDVDASSLPVGSPYLQLVIADGTDTDFAAATALLSGLRYAGDQNPTATN